MAPLLVALPACGPPAPRHSITYEAVADRVSGFDARQPASPAAPEVLVFFDSQCKHCARLWRESAPLAQQVRFRWVPVALLNNASLEKGAVILGAAQPAAAMDEHERLFTADRRGIGVGSGPAARWRDAVKANTQVFNDLGATGVPTMLWRDGAGAWHTATGAYPTAELRSMLGL